MNKQADTNPSSSCQQSHETIPPLDKADEKDENRYYTSLGHILALQANDPSQPASLTSSRCQASSKTF